MEERAKPFFQRVSCLSVDFYGMAGLQSFLREPGHFICLQLQSLVSFAVCS